MKSHGQSNEHFYDVWRAMLRRCTNPKSKSYPRYGGRGITVCPEWQEYAGFRAWAQSSGYAEGLSLDRRDNDEGYSPDNCRWIDMGGQYRNRSSNKFLTAFGETKCLTDWVSDPRSLVKSTQGLNKRLKNGMTPEEALTCPPMNSRPSVGEANRKRGK